MEFGKLSVIPGSLVRPKTTLIFVMILTLGLFLLACMISDLRMTVLLMDHALCDLRRRLGQMNSEGRVSSFTGTVSLIPVMAPKVVSVPADPKDMRTEHI